METAAEFYAMAELCDRQAAEVDSERVRQILLEAAAQWRRLGEGLAAIHKSASQQSPPSSPT